MVTVDISRRGGGITIFIPAEDEMGKARYMGVEQALAHICWCSGENRSH